MWRSCRHTGGRGKSTLLFELNITRQTLYRHVAPDGTLRKDGLKVLKVGRHGIGTERNSDRGGLPRFSVQLLLGPHRQEFWNAGEYHEIVPHEKIVSSMYFSDSKGNKVEPEQYGIEHEAIDGAYDVVTFEDLGNGQTKLTFVGNETMEDAKESGQLEGWNQVLDKLAAVLTDLAQAKIRN